MDSVLLFIGFDNGFKSAVLLLNLKFIIGIHNLTQISKTLSQNSSFIIMNPTAHNYCRFELPERKMRWSYNVTDFPTWYT